MSVWEVVKESKGTICDMIAITHMPGATIAPGQLAFTSSELLVAQQSSGNLQKLLHWPIKDNDMTVTDCAGPKITGRQVTAIATCSDVYMLVVIGFQSGEHGLAYLYHALTKELVMKIKTKDRLESIALVSVPCNDPKFVGVSAQTRQLIGQFTFKVLLLTSSGDQVTLT